MTESSTTTTAMPATSPAAKDASAEERRAAAALMGRARTPAKIAASRRNALLGAEKGGRPLKPLADIECACGVGDALEGHNWACPRGQAIKRRRKAGKL